METKEILEKSKVVLQKNENGVASFQLKNR